MRKNAPSTSPRPRARPQSPLAPTTSPRPMSREEGRATQFLRRQNEREAREERAGMAAGGKVKKMAQGGMARGCGAATKGKRYTRGG